MQVRRGGATRCLCVTNTLEMFFLRSVLHAYASLAIVTLECKETSAHVYNRSMRFPFVDDYPAGNEKMEVPGDEEGDGSHFDPDAPYRFYHGNKIPGNNSLLCATR